MSNNKVNKFNKKIKGKQNVILADNNEIVFSDEPQKVKAIKIVAIVPDFMKI